jgi:hypothetical protein
MTKDRLEQPDNPAKVKDGAAQSAAEDLAPPAGSQRSEQRARGVLAELESCLATHDLGQMVDFFTEDVVLVGDEEEAFGRNALRDYLRGMAEMAPTVRWDWHRRRSGPGCARGALLCRRRHDRVPSCGGTAAR